MDPKDDSQRAIREMVEEIGRAADAAVRLVRQGVDDAQRRMGPRGPRRPRGGPVEAAEAIRALGRLRDEGLITEEEFQAKKRDLLERM
ncbi:MAG TPA: SHOCT domain-containing protein [Miltoncostaeaceae bacterium]|nr:SHOCT domain-containing protein [Miltoncostaeaceae bacterium]